MNAQRLDWKPQDLMWQPFDPEPLPLLIDVEVARTDDGWAVARTPRCPDRTFHGHNIEEAAEGAREYVQRTERRAVKIRRPTKSKKRK